MMSDSCDKMSLSEYKMDLSAVHDKCAEIPKLHKGTIRCLSESKTGEVVASSSVMSYTVFVVKLGNKITEGDLEEAVRVFLSENEAFGDGDSDLTVNARIMPNKNGVSKGWGFLDINNDDACKLLIAKKTLTVGGKEIKMAEARKKLPGEIICERRHVAASNKRGRLSKHGLPADVPESNGNIDYQGTSKLRGLLLPGVHVPGFPTVTKSVPFVPTTLSSPPLTPVTPHNITAPHCQCCYCKSAAPVQLTPQAPLGLPLFGSSTGPTAPLIYAYRMSPQMLPTAPQMLAYNPAQAHYNPASYPAPLPAYLNNTHMVQQPMSQFDNSCVSCRGTGLLRCH